MTVPVIGWGRKCFQFSLQVPVASGRFWRWCSKLFIQSVRGCLSISKFICRALPEQRSGLSWHIDYRLLRWGCQNSLCFLMHLKGKDGGLILLEILLRRHHKIISFRMYLSESIFYSGHGTCSQPTILVHSVHVHPPLTCRNWTSWNSSWMNLRDGSRKVQCASK